MRRTDREISSPETLAGILQKGDVCHVALVDDGKPYIVALNYGFAWNPRDDGALPVLYFHCANAGKKLDILRKNGAAAFFIDTDHLLVTGEKDCEWGMKYRSVAGSGTVSIVDGQAEKKAGLDSIMRHYSGRSEFSYDETLFAHTVILRLSVSEMTGKQKQ